MKNVTQYYKTVNDATCKKLKDYWNKTKYPELDLWFYILFYQLEKA